MGRVREAQALQLAMVCAALSITSAVFLHDCLNRDSSWTILFIWGGLLGALVVTTAVCMDIWRLEPADSHTLTTLVTQYLAVTLLRLSHRHYRSLLTKLTKNPTQVDEESLMRIIRTNEDTEYGHEHKFRDIHSIEDFMRQLPITRDTDNKAWVDRMLAGEQNVLFPGKPCFFASTSGTTGAAKVYPLNKNYVRKFKSSYPLILISVSHMMNLKRWFYFHISTKLDTTTGGTPIGAMTQFLHALGPFYLTPCEYKQLLDEDASHYAMALFCLAERELGVFLCFSADLTNSFMQFMVRHWEQLCDDIGQGRVGEAINMPADVRQALSARLTPDVKRARELRSIMREGGVVELARRAWPDLAFVTMGKVAGFKMLATKLMENHFKGVKVIQHSHVATEGLTGINTEEKEPESAEGFTLLPGITFKEFIPLSQVEEDSPSTLLMHQLKVGESYEIVQTNENGLYRCRYGDIIRVTGFYNATPTYEFLYRLGQRLNIAYERTPEKFLYEALAAASLPPGVNIMDYTSTESVVTDAVEGKESKGRYIFFIEFNTTLDDDTITKLSTEVDEKLRGVYELYDKYRSNNMVALLQITQVKNATFDGLRRILMGGKFNNQFKMPRVLRKEPAIKHLLSNAIR